MLVIVLCFYAAFAASVAIIIVIFGLFLARKAHWVEGLFVLIALQLAIGVCYMLAINLDAGPGAQIDWTIAVLCGLVGGAISVLVAYPVTRFFARRQRGAG